VIRENIFTFPFVYRSCLRSYRSIPLRPYNSPESELTLEIATLTLICTANSSRISLGAVNSPQILLNSGLGPREELNAVGVPVVRDLPGVGKNLHNHVAYTLTFTINDTDTTPLNWATAMEYLLFRDGLMSGTGEPSRLLSENRPQT